MEAKYWEAHGNGYIIDLCYIYLLSDYCFRPFLRTLLHTCICTQDICLDFTWKKLERPWSKSENAWGKPQLFVHCPVSDRHHWIAKYKSSDKSNHTVWLVKGLMNHQEKPLYHWTAWALNMLYKVLRQSRTWVTSKHILVWYFHSVEAGKRYVLSTQYMRKVPSLGW